MDGDFELEIGAGPGPGGYQVRVVHAAAGGEPVGALQLDVGELVARRPTLEATLIASSVSARRVVPIAEQPVQEVGRRLFEALFTGSVNGAYRASLGVAQERHHRLRVVLRLTAPELAALPWEMLFDPETGTYLCRQQPVVRHVPAPFTPDPLEVRPPLRILGLVASPRGLPLLDTTAERQRLQEALAEPIAAGQVRLEWVEQASWYGVQARLLSDPWHVLHFVGHGDYDPDTQEGVLALIGPGGRADLVEAGRLADLLSEAEPTPRLVVLNSCSSGESGGSDLFSGTAAALVHSGISAVAAMQFTVSDTAAVAFARGFYAALASGRTVDEAVRSGRISILGIRGTLEWLTPVLYVRGDTTRLFSFTGDAPLTSGHDENRSGEAARRNAELHSLNVKARAELRVDNYDAAIGLLDELLLLAPNYPNATDLRDTARRHKKLAESYRLAGDADNTGDWLTAAALYAEVLAADPTYRDTAARKEACERRHQVAELQAELRLHAAAGRWQAVIDADADIVGIDPTAANPDGLTAQARHALAEEERAAGLDHSYAPARADEDGGNWPRAANYIPAPRTIQVGQWVTAMAISPDGVWLATGSRQRIRMWNLRAGTAFWERQIGSWRDDVSAVAFGPDGTLLITGSTNGDVQIWDAATGKQQLQLGHAAAVVAVTFSPDGTQVATAGGGNTARTFDAVTGDPGLWLRHDGLVTSVAFSSQGGRLATGSHDKTVRLWNATTGDQQRRLRHDDRVLDVKFSPDGTRLATGSSNGDVRIWSAVNGSQKLQFGLNGAVTAVAFSPDGTRLATAGSDNTARIFDATGRQLLQVTHMRAVTAVAFSRDGTRLATGSSDKTARIWDATTDTGHRPN